MRRRLVIASECALLAWRVRVVQCLTAMMWSFLGWGKGIIPQGAIRPQPEGGESGEEVRGFRSGGIWLPKGVVMGGAQDA